MVALPQTGSSALLEILSPFINDDLIHDLIPPPRGPGRPRGFSSSQLLRVHLLALLTPCHSFNLLLELLPDNRMWRKFARLPNKHALPDAKVLFQFRGRLSLTILRQINLQLLAPLLAKLHPSSRSLAIVDSTDLRASTSDGFKKKKPFRLNEPLSGNEPRKPGKAHSLLAIKNTP